MCQYTERLFFQELSINLFRPILISFKKFFFFQGLMLLLPQIIYNKVNSLENTFYIHSIILNAKE